MAKTQKDDPTRNDFVYARCCGTLAKKRTLDLSVSFSRVLVDGESKRVRNNHFDHKACVGATDETDEDVQVD